MLTNDRPVLSADVILEATWWHGLRLARGRWHNKWSKPRTVCAASAYGLAVMTDRQRDAALLSSCAMEKSGVSWATIQGLIAGFEGYWRWLDRILSRDYRRAYRVGREVWARRSEVEVKPVEPSLASPPPPLGRLDDDREPELATVGADDFEPEDHWRNNPGG